MRVFAVLALILASALAGCAQQADTFAIDGNEGRSLRVVGAPTAADIRNVYPAAAKLRGVTGRVELICILNAEGAFTNCRVVREDPAGEGFGAAALRTVLEARRRVEASGVWRFDQGTVADRLVDVYGSLLPSISRAG